MRLVLTLLLVALLAPAIVVDQADARCKKGCKGKCCEKKCCDKKGEMETTEFIYDVTIPWPFRHRSGDEDGDGVPDDRDMCPGTPKGAIVDKQGCPMDTDGDGVYDGIDKCPGTPKGAMVDRTGCPLDTDGDGVYDGIDRCPQTPKGVIVDRYGCGLDSDDDGVPDGLDRCPDTPKGAKVDKHGCPLDSDGDGVPDGIDRCPNTPPGTTVDKYGCTIRETEFLDTGIFTTSDILFEIGKSDIKPDSYPLLDRIGGSLVQWPELRIEIGGYTDSSGSTELNQRLSEQRAAAVLDYLAKKFPEIERSQFTTKGYGENDPIATNDTKEGRAKNRRVQFKILNKGQLKRQK
ncbi:MAG: OmpA family protein [Candidatus Latescibacterota bacterium]|nr:MAG: OmpA family protein [Candidatus Latescibacterota bacterium]